MSDPERTPQAEALSALVLDLFSLTNGLLTAGDRLVAALGLTSARWQVLGAALRADRPQPVAWLARDMGVSRQNVQRIVNDLVSENFIALADNPHHKRAPLMTVTPTGEAAFAAAMRRQIPWINGLAEDLTLADLTAMARVVASLKRRLTDADQG